MKKIKIRLLCVLVLTIIGAGILIAIQWPRPTLVEMGKPIILSEEVNLETRGMFNYYRGFGWGQGSCEFTLTGAEVYSSIQDAGILQEDMAESSTQLIGDDIKFLLLKIEVKNIDAISVDNDGSNGDLHIGFISLLPERYFTGLGVFDTNAGIDHGMISQEYEPNMAYFSDHMIMQEGASSEPYFHFNLKPGELANYEIGFFVSGDFIVKEQMMLSYGTNKYASKIEVKK